MRIEGRPHPGYPVYMDKLVERESATRNPLVAAPALAVQFFLIPLAVVGVTVMVYAGFRSLVADDRSAQDYLAEIRLGGANRRWPAAYELSRLMADPAAQSRAELAPALVEAFEAARTDDPRVRRYLALAIGRLTPPLPPQAVNALTGALEDPDDETRISVIWALGSSGDPAVIPTLEPLYASQDAGIRKMVVYALGALPGEAQLDTLRTALEDAAPDVRWNAAVALARHGQAQGVPVIQEMLNRPFLEQTITREPGQYDDEDPVAEVLISGVRAAAALRDDSLRASLEELSREDRNMKVRQAALEALRTMG
jgi:HEAT repeat protein